MNLEPIGYVDHEIVHIALSMCCGESNRYDMRRPFRAGRYVYATNGIIIARVPEWCAPWITDADYKGRITPNPDSLPWNPELYSNAAADWPKLPRPAVPKCDRCNEECDSYPTVFDLCDFSDPPQICKKCGAYSASESGQDYKIGDVTLNARIMRRLYTLGVALFPPVNKDGGTNPADPLHAWRWELSDARMVGLVMPVKAS